MQVKIKTITDLSLALQVAEQRNNVIVRNRFNSIRKDVYQAKKNREVASNYYKSMNNISSQSYLWIRKNENINFTAGKHIISLILYKILNKEDIL